MIRSPSDARARVQVNLGKTPLSHRKEASWRNMLVCQPPQPTIRVRIKTARYSQSAWMYSSSYSSFDRANFEGVIWSRAGKGVTIGDCLYAMMGWRAREVEIIGSEGWDRVD